MNSLNQSNKRGPWTVRPAYDNGEPCGYVVQTGVNAIADVPQGEADAHLIAAAPDLLSALDNALRFLPHSAPGAKDVLHPALSKARAAIAKATHWPVTAGQCPVCGRYGEDCTAPRKGTA